MKIKGPNQVEFQINSRTDMVQFVYALKDDLNNHPENWSNTDRDSFLGALAAFMQDSHGYYKNYKLDVDVELPSWRLFADCLQAAKIYE